MHVFSPLFLVLRGREHLQTGRDEKGPRGKTVPIPSSICAFFFFFSQGRLICSASSLQRPASSSGVLPADAASPTVSALTREGPAVTQSVLLGHGGDFSRLFRGLINYTRGNRREGVWRALCLSCWIRPLGGAGGLRWAAFPSIHVKCTVPFPAYQCELIRLTPTLLTDRPDFLETHKKQRSRMKGRGIFSIGPRLTIDPLKVDKLQDKQEKRNRALVWFNLTRPHGLFLTTHRALCERTLGARRHVHTQRS